MENIKLVLLLSGKRKCGKDFLSERLQKRLGSKFSQIVRISEPIKSEWAKKLNLDLEMLLSDGPYKENYRKDMIVWSDSVRAEDYGYFCRKAIEVANKKIVIISDIRRKNDVKCFRELFENRVKTIRISCPDETRMARGWIFQAGVDDVQSECDLDDFSDWDLQFDNDGTLDGDAIVERVFEQFELSKFLD